MAVERKPKDKAVLAAVPCVECGAPIPANAGRLCPACKDDCSMAAYTARCSSAFDRSNR